MCSVEVSCNNLRILYQYLQVCKKSNMTFESEEDLGWKG